MHVRRNVHNGSLGSDTRLATVLLRDRGTTIVATAMVADTILLDTALCTAHKVTQPPQVNSIDDTSQGCHLHISLQ